MQNGSEEEMQNGSEEEMQNGGKRCHRKLNNRTNG